jgi:tetratricopeptide (TPR) repeat protein
VQGPGTTNTLPITTIATDHVTFPIDAPNSSKPGQAQRRPGSGLTEMTPLQIPAQPQATDETSVIRENAVPSPVPPWQRWNDYGIALLLEGNQPSDRGELAQAEQAFEQVEKLGRADGPMNLARAFFKEGRLNDATAALSRAAKFSPPAPPWTISWLSGLIDQQNGNLDRAIDELQAVVDNRWPDADRRGFDFSMDYEVLNALGQTLFDRAKREPSGSSSRREFLLKASARFEQTLAIDSENLAAHYALWQIDDQLGDSVKAQAHRLAHGRFRPDDNARDRAVSLARHRDKAADHAAGAVVVYELRGGSVD